MDHDDACILDMYVNRCAIYRQVWTCTNLSFGRETHLPLSTRQSSHAEIRHELHHGQTTDASRLFTAFWWRLNKATAAYLQRIWPRRYTGRSFV